MDVSSLLTSISENQVLTVLAVLAFILMVVLTLGVGYLTVIEWRDRRRRNREAAAIPSFRNKRR